MPAFRMARPLAVAATVSVLFAACADDPTAPEFTEESAIEIAAAAEAVTDPIEATTTVQANLVNAYFALSAFNFPATAMQPFQVLSRVRSPFLAPRIAALPAIPAAPTGVLIPDEFEGTTLVWSTTEQKYVASEEAGAPENGIRFIYYAVDPVSDNPVEPLNPLGHIDLIDESTDTQARLEVVAVRDQGNVTLADYFVAGSLTGNLSTTTVTIDSEGFFSDGTEQLDFDMQMISSANDEGTTGEWTVELDAPGGSIDLHSEETATVTEVDGEVTDIVFDATTTFAVAHGGTESVFEYATTGNVNDETTGLTIDGSLSVGGEVVVIFSGEEDDPVFTRPDGGALTDDEVAALGRVWVAAGLTLGFVGQVLLPFFLLLAFAV